MDAMSDHEPFAPGNPVLSVSSLNQLVRDCLETAFPLTFRRPIYREMKAKFAR